ALKAPLDGLWALRPGRAPRRVYSAPGSILLTDVSPDRRVLMVQTDWRQEVEVRTEGEPSQALEWLEWGLLGGISDDGPKVLFFEFGRGAAGGSIPGMLLLRDTRESEPVILGRGRGLALSPDGRWALAATDSRTLILLPTGPGESRKLPIPLARIQRAAFFRDGARLALVGWSTSEGRSGLFLYDMSTGECRPITPDPVANLSVFVSFDQRHVAVSDTEGNIKAYALDGSVAFRVPAWTDNFQLAGWLQDGSVLAFDRTAVPARVERYDPRTGAVTLFTTLGPSDAAGVTGIGRAAVTPDGRTIAYQLRRMSGVLSVLDWGDAPPWLDGNDASRQYPWRVRLVPGSKVGHYEVLAALGAGGMSEVYRARDPRLQREVALKVVGDRLAGDASFLARLEQEARLAGSLNHPNIVAVHDVG